MKAREAIDNMNQALRVWAIGWRCSFWWLCKRRGLLSWEPHPVDWMTSYNLIHLVIMPNAGNTIKKKKKKKIKKV